MPTFETSMGGNAREFPSTHWSEVLFSENHPRRQEAYAYLVDRYWKPVYHYVRTLHDVPAEDAKDLTQQFFTMLLSRRLLSGVSPERGTLRGLLKISLKNFLTSAHRATVSRLPRDGKKLFPFEKLEHEWQVAYDGSPPLTPDEAFDREWARETMKEAVARLQRKAAEEKKGIYFHLFRDYYLEPLGLPDRDSADLYGIRPHSKQPSYDELSRRHRIEENDVRHHLRTARQKIRDILTHLLSEELGTEEHAGNVLKRVFSP